jgi:hypothetical protein
MENIDIDWLIMEMDQEQIKEQYELIRKERETLCLEIKYILNNEPGEKRRLRELNTKVCEIKKKQEKLKKRYKRLSIICSCKEDVEKIEESKLLSTDEITVILENMDSKDYRNNENVVRWLDLETIIKEVVSIKNKYPGWKLVDLGKNSKIDTYPPKNNYSHRYVTPQGDEFTYGDMFELSKMRC